MDKKTYTSFMALHSHPIIEGLTKLRDISNGDALDLFYTSKLYETYEREDTKLWHFSNVTLTELLNHEITQGHIVFPVEG